MFLPQDMSESEKGLAATIARQVLAQDLGATTELERQRLRHRAEEIAAETIWEARGASSTVEESEPDEWSRWLADKAATEARLSAELIADLDAEAEAINAEVDEYRRRVRAGEIKMGDELPD